MDVKSYEEQEETLALLKILALGNREIEQGKFRDAEDVFAELDKADHPMSLKVVILESAEHDLTELRRYIVKNFSLETWQNTYDKIKKVIRNLKTFPYTGSIPEELEKLNLSQYRQVISGMNRIIYEVRQDTLYIHIIVDGRRDMASLLTRRLLRDT